MKAWMICVRFALVLQLCITISPLAAQTDKNAIDSASFTVFAQPNLYIDIHFTNALATPAVDLTPGNIQITTTPTSLTPPLSAPSPALMPGSRRSVRLSFSSNIPAPEPSSTRICFSQVAFLESDNSVKVTQNVCANAQILNSDNVVAQKALQLKSLQTVPKTNSEKNIFASGFVTSASAGTAGGLNLDLNSNQIGIPGMTVFLRTNKTSVAGGDPKSLEIGSNFRGTYLFGKATIQRIRDDIAKLSSNPSNTMASQDINDAEQALRNRILTALVVDVAGKLEGEGTNFNVGNYVADLQTSLQSRTNTLFGSRKGFWSFRLVPGGFEGGKNVQTSSSSSSNSPSSSPSPEDLIARFKGGGELHLFYDDPTNIIPFKRIDLSGDTAQRYLFLREARTSPLVAGNSFERGSRPWYEANLMVFFAETASGRYGFKLTYNDGSLPPSFSKARSFNFGFVFETSDGEQK